jgi:bifunctional non-homologous end joining protein LigD
VPALKKLPCKSATLDGEIVALDEHGHSAFQLLQAYEMHEKKPPICYYAFDLLTLDGKDLRSLPLIERKAQLEVLLANVSDPIRFSASLHASYKQLLKQIKRHGLEGLIGKLRNSTYETGERSGAWIKLKVQNAQEFVIGGYTAPQRSRKFFGALIVGFFEKGDLLFAAKVGTGYTKKTLEELYKRMQPLRRETCPFSNLPTKRAGKSRQGGIANWEMEYCTWLTPKLVCQVRFTEWTGDCSLRHPAYLGLREDKRPEEVICERAA